VIAKVVRAIRQVIAVDAEQRVQGLDFDIELLHQSNRHRSQVRQAPANSHLRQPAMFVAGCLPEQCKLTKQSLRKIVASRFACASHGHRGAPIFITPRQLPGGHQAAVTHECDTRRGLVQGDVRLVPTGDGKRLSQARETQESFCRRDNRVNPGLCREEWRERSRDVLSSGQGEHHRLTIGPGYCRRRAGNVSESPLRIDALVPGDVERLSTHSLVRTIRHDDLSMFGTSTPDNDGDGSAREPGKPPVRLGALPRQDLIRTHTGRRCPARVD
jgi:hypothetical protein